MGEQVKKWYVVRAVSGKEKKVKQYIESEINRLGICRILFRRCSSRLKKFIWSGKEKRSARKGIIFLDMC